MEHDSQTLEVSEMPFSRRITLHALWEKLEKNFDQNRMEEREAVVEDEPILTKL